MPCKIKPQILRNIHPLQKTEGLIAALEIASPLAEQVFSEAVKQQQAKRLRLKAERKRLQQERQHKGERIKELVAAIGASGQPFAILAESLAELESTVVCMDRRLAEIGEELTTIDRDTIDTDNVAAALAPFDPVWDELYPAEKTRTVSLLIERVEYDAQKKKMHIAFRPTGIKDLPKE